MNVVKKSRANYFIAFQCNSPVRMIVYDDANTTIYRMDKIISHIVITLYTYLQD